MAAAEDVCLGQRRSELTVSAAANAGPGDVQPLKAGQSLEMGQPGIADCGAGEVQHAQPPHAIEVHQPGIVNLGIGEGHVPETDEALQVRQPGVTDLSTAERQGKETGEALQALQAGIADPGPVETQFFETPALPQMRNPASPTMVPSSESPLSTGSSESCARASSEILVWERSSRRRLVNPLSWTIPASVTVE